MHQLNRAMSKIISVEDDLVSNDELNPEVQIEKTEIENTIVRPKFNVDTKKLWNKRCPLPKLYVDPVDPNFDKIRQSQMSHVLHYESFLLCR